MGANTGKMQPELIDKLTNAKQALENGEISLTEARDVLDDVTKRVEEGPVKIKGDALQEIRGKLRTLSNLIIDLEELEDQRREQQLREQLSNDAKEQLAKGRKIANLVEIYSQDYGRLNPVKALLEAGRNNGGFRNPKEGLKLGPIAEEVHYYACKGGGFSSHTSTSNGLVNRIREQSAIVVDNAYNAGYPVEEEAVIKAMAILAREIAFTLDSDSGDRNYKKEDMPRGMSYNLDTKVPGIDPELLKGGFSQDPSVILASHRDAVIKLQFQLDKANGQQAERLRTELARIREEILELEKQGVK